MIAGFWFLGRRGKSRSPNVEARRNDECWNDQDGAKVFSSLLLEAFFVIRQSSFIIRMRIAG